MKKIDRVNLIPYASGLASGIENLVRGCEMCQTSTLEAIVSQLEDTYNVVKAALVNPDAIYRRIRVFDSDNRKTVLWAKSFTEAKEWILDPAHGRRYYTLDVIGADGEVEEWYTKESLQGDV